MIDLMTSQTKITNTVSVIIPCKNEQDTIGLLIDNLIDTNLADEIIVVNDGS